MSKTLKALEEISKIDQELGLYPSLFKENECFSTGMSLIRSMAPLTENASLNMQADKTLLDCVQKEMSAKLEKSSLNGRHGWWDPNVCSMEFLYGLRNKAIEDGDHVSTLNFTAMIAMREHGDKE